MLRERIGEGGFGAVYRCEQPALDREAVIKVLHHRLRDNDVVVQRFMREAQLASKIDHPYSAHVYAFGVERDDGLCWIAMEMVHGTTLDRWLGSRGPLALDQLVPLFDRIAEVVETAHGRGIVHRDLKPSNIMVMERAGRLLPKLLDLGIAKIVDDAQVSSTEATPPPRPNDVLSAKSLTLTNAMLGSPPYMAPEQWANPLSVGPQSDLYALAIIAYEALTGRRPFEADTITEYVTLHATAEVPPLGAGFPVELDRFFARALAKNPDDRLPNALALADALRTAAIPPAQEVAPQAPPRRPWLAIVAALGVLAAGVVAFAIVNRSPESSDHREAASVETRDAALADTAVVGVAVGHVDATALEPAGMVSLHIDSQPSGADVFRLPSQVKVGTTPWDGELDKTDGTAVFAIKRSGYRDGRTEIDLRFGASVRVVLARIGSSSSPPPHPGDQRHKGEPADPFKENK